MLLVFANKQDLPNALSASELTERLKLNQVKRNVSLKWIVLGINAGVGER